MRSSLRKTDEEIGRWALVFFECHAGRAKTQKHIILPCRQTSLSHASYQSDRSLERSIRESYFPILIVQRKVLLYLFIYLFLISNFSASSIGRMLNHFFDAASPAQYISGSVTVSL